MMGRIAPVLALLLWLGLPGVTWAQTPPAVTTAVLAERRVSQLPAGTLVWRLETFPTGAAAVAATGSTGVAAEFGGTNYLLTLGPAGSRTPGSTPLAETGPVPVPRGLAQYLLRLVALTGPAGSQSAVHTHPGAEGYYVVSGEFGGRAQAGTVRVPTGRTFVGPPSGTPVQAVNTGTSDMRVLVLFALDASQPPQSDATLADAARAALFIPFPVGLPATGAGALGPGATLPGTLALAAVSLGLAFLTAGRRQRQRQR